MNRRHTSPNRSAIGIGTVRSAGPSARRLLWWVALACASFAWLAPPDVPAGEKSGDKKTETQATSQGEQCNGQQGAEKKCTAKQSDPYGWKNLFDGKTLGQWKAPNFGGQAEVVVKDGAIVIGMGDPMTGITWTGPLPRDNYELALEAKRTQGIDFFATTTFPVGDSTCSFVVGGWGGTVVGLSCVDYYDASDNFTSQFMAFDDNRWYQIRIRVSKAKIECWIDDDKMVDIPREGHKFTIRAECDLCQPLGIATWCTEGVVRNIRIRKLTPEEVSEIEKSAEQ